MGTCAAQASRYGLPQHVDQLFCECEQRGECLIPTDKPTQHQLLHLYGQDRIRRPFRGMYARCETWDALDPRQRHLHIMSTLASKHPAWTFCGPSAALLHGLAVSNDSLSKIHVAQDGLRRTSSASLAWDWADPRDPIEIHGIQATSLAQTSFDCMRTMSFGNALAIADSALRISRHDRSWLQSAIGMQKDGFHGARHARQAASFADGRAESGGESIARATMIQHGFMLPELQVVIRDPISGQQRRVDFFWELPGGRRVIGELDGRQKYVDPAMTNGRDAIGILADERLRESRLTLNAPVMRFSYRDVVADNGRRLARIMDAFGIPRTRDYDPMDLRPPK